MEFQWVAVIGVQGAGKSTVLRELTRVESMERYE